MPAGPAGRSGCRSRPSPQADESRRALGRTLPSMVIADDPRILELTAPEGDLVARFATQVGMVGCSLRHERDELLGIGGGLEAYVDQGKVFGIPLLYPWPNRLGDCIYDVDGRHVELDRGSHLLHVAEL